MALVFLIALGLTGCNATGGGGEDASSVQHEAGAPPAQERHILIERNKPIGYASRLFAGPGQQLPGSYRAYGIVAFKSRATEYDRDRHLTICKAYYSSLSSSSTLAEKHDIPRSRQMVTVWPIETDAAAQALESGEEEEICDSAVDHYDLERASVDRNDPAFNRHVNDGRGPFLLAWSPTNKVGELNVEVLILDLSYVDTYAQAQRMFHLWVDEIQGDISLWDQEGWDVPQLQSKIRRLSAGLGMLADRHGKNLLAFFDGRG
ncbi:MAG: hypothetical protein ACR2RF_09435 [Geminicoccaceae bacterium]